MDKIGDAQFRVMCRMWGVDQAVKTLGKMGMEASEEQVAAALEREAEESKRWKDIFKEDKA